VWLCVFYPKYAFAFYVLNSTKFLGFFDSEAFFVINGIGLAFPAINSIFLLSIVFKKHTYKIPKLYKRFALVLIVLLLYGTIKPLIHGHETMFQAITASKELWVTFFFLYLIVNRKNIPVHYVIRFMLYLGIYICASYILFYTTGISAFEYYNTDVFRAYFPTYISLAWFLSYYKWLNKKLSTTNMLMFNVFFFIGLVLAEHLALTLSNIFVLSLYHFVLKDKKTYSYSTFVKSFSIVLIFGYLVITLQPIRSQINSIITGEHYALSSRETYNEFRWQAIYDRPILGNGFIHKSSSLTEQYLTSTNNRYMERLEVIDSGYVDILIKFGIIGLVVIMYLWVVPIYSILKDTRTATAIEICCALYLLQYFFVNYTWSVFTFSHGLIPGLMVVWIIFRYKEARFISRKLKIKN
jgi:O-antigen ligase